MKKILLAFAIATASLATLSSCTKEYITLTSRTYDPTIESTKWSRVSGATNLYSTTLDFPEINGRIVDDGNVQVSLRFTGANGKLLSSYNTIPATINGIHYSHEIDAGVLIIYAEILRNTGDLDIDHLIQAKVIISESEYAGN